MYVCITKKKILYLQQNDTDGDELSQWLGNPGTRRSMLELIQSEKHTKFS